MDQQFYIHLPSNASMQLHPENTTASYKVALPSRIELEGEWEVGLAEITYTVSWFNIPAKEYFRVRVPSGPADEDGVIRKWTDVGEESFEIPEGFYEYPIQLIETMRRIWDEYWKEIKEKVRRYLVRSGASEMKEEEKAVIEEGVFINHVKRPTIRRRDSAFVPNTTHDCLEIKYDRYSNRALFVLLHRSHQLELSPILSDVFSIGENDHDDHDADRLAEVLKEVKTYKSKSSVDLNRGNRQMYVYCSLIEDSIVGDSRVPLLRSFPLSGRKAGSVNESFSRIYYVPLKKQIFDNIEIELRNEVGQLIQFQYGHSNCVLHFRRIAPRVLI